MTDASLICRYIRDHPNDWRELLEQKNINIKDDGRLSLFKYGIGADFSDPIVCEARGIIIDHRTLDVVCWPFKKFFNIQEPNAAEIDWNTAKVQDKIDGSLIKVWYDWQFTTWRASTMSTINASTASTQIGRTFYDLFCSAINFKSIRWYDMSKLNTYLFELVSPETQVVIRYPVTKIWHIGTINNLTGEDIICDIGIEHPIEYPLATLDDCMSAVEHLNEDGLEKEGFVVVDGNFNRVKIKTPEYLEMHRSVNNHMLSPDRYVALIASHPEDIDNMCNIFPQHERMLRYYQWQLAELKFRVNEIIEMARRVQEEYNNQRKIIAEHINKSRYSYFGFKALDTNLTAEEMIQALTPKQIVKFLEEYK